MKKRSFKNGLFKGNLSFITLLVLLSGALIVSLLFAVTIGSSNISMADVYKVIIRQFLALEMPLMPKVPFMMSSGLFGFRV